MNQSVTVSTIAIFTDGALVKVTDIQDIEKQLQNIFVEIPVKAGANGKVFGGVTAKDICEKLKEQNKIEIDKIRTFEMVLQNPNSPQANIDVAQEGIRLCNKSIDNLTALNKPFSGMLIAQI